MTNPDPETAAPRSNDANRAVARGIGTTVLARIGAIVEIVAQPLYVLMFGLAGYGLYAVMWAAVTLAENIFDLGMPNAMQRTVPQATSDREAAAALRTALLLGVGPCLVVAALISWQAAAIAPLINVAAADAATVAPAIRLFVWALPLWAFVEITTAALRARMLFGPEIRLRIVWEQLIRLGLAVGAYAAGWGLIGLFAAHVGSLVVTAVLCWRLLARHYDLRLIRAGPPWPNVAKATALAGISVLPSNILTRLLTDAPALILNQLLPGAAGAAASGLFTIARKLSSVVQLIRLAFVYVVAPLASSSERQDRAAVEGIFAYAFRLIFVIALPLAVVLAAGAMPLLTLFGPQAQAAQIAFILLVAARAAEAIFGIALPVLQVVSAYRHQIAAPAVTLGLTIPVLLLLLSLFPPLEAVTAASAFGIVTMAAIPFVQLYRIEGMSPFQGSWARWFWGSVALALAAGALALAVTHIGGGAMLPVIPLLALAAIWVGLRMLLSPADRQSFGRAGRALRLA